MTTATDTTPIDDPYTAAMNAQARTQDKHYFGEVVIVDPWFAVLRKGVGKLPFDPQQHPLDERVTVIKLEIACTKRDHTAYTIDQETVDFDAAWTRVTLPSLVTLGISLRDLNGSFVQVTRKESGDTFTGNDGQTKKRYGLHFSAVYPTREAMQQAADTLYGQRSTPAATAYTGMPDAPLPDAPAPAASMHDNGTMDAMQKFALESLPRLWEQAGGKQVAVGSPEWATAKDKLAKLLQGTGFDQFYPITHPHTIGLMQATITDDDIPF